LDGELTEQDWRNAARSGPFVDASGSDARPFSKVRMLWDESYLYLGLYAGDEDIRAAVRDHDGPVWTDDAFVMRFEAMDRPTFSYLIDVSAAGVVTDVRRDATGRDDPSWDSGMELAVDRDGTLNDPTDWDEEWVIEARVPLRALAAQGVAGTSLLVQIHRCDTPRGGGAKRCASFGGPKDEPRAIELRP